MEVKGGFKPGVAMSSAGRGGNSDEELSLDSEVISGSTRTSLVRSKCSKRRTKIAPSFLTMSWSEVFVGNSTGSSSPNLPASEERSLKVSPQSYRMDRAQRRRCLQGFSSSSNSSSSICISTYGDD